MMMTKRRPHLPLWIVALSLTALAACGGTTPSTETDPAEAASEAPAASEITVETGSIAAAIAGAHRTDERRARDAHRHPAETLEFFGLEPGMTVIEMSPSGGWYTDILAPVLRDQGKLYGAIADPAENKYSKRFLARMAEHPGVFDKVESVIFEIPGKPSLGAPNSVDMVLTFRSTHGWINRGQAEAAYAAMFDVLKSGGTLGVVQHRADEGADPIESSKNGYVPESYVIELAQNAGFKLSAKSPINANPKDDHDHPEGVWTLPPTLRLEDQDRAQWEAIGESDRMTLRFIKP